MIRAILLTCLILGTAAGPLHAQAKIPILFDFDIGEDIDDTFALATVIASPELELVGVTTVGHDPVKRAQMASRFLTAVGFVRKDFVAAGLAPKGDKPLAYWQVQYGNHASVAFRDPKPAKVRAPEFLYNHLKEKDSGLTIVAVGPLTNIAKLLTDHPDAKAWIKRIVLMGGSVYRGYNPGSKPQPEWNIVSDVKAAQAVFRSGIPLVVAPLDATAMVRLDAKRQKKLFDRGSLLTLSVQALVQLWREKNDPILFDPVAVTLTHTEKFCTMENLALDVDDKGITVIVKDKKPNARVAVAIKSDEYLDWLVDRLVNAQPPSWPSGRIVNPAKMAPRGNMPNRVHVFEDFETDIEKRWWLAGRLGWPLITTERRVILDAAQCKANSVDPQHVFTALELMYGSTIFNDAKRFIKEGERVPAEFAFGKETFKNLHIRNSLGMMIPLPKLAGVKEVEVDPNKIPPGGNRALRGVLTQDFDDRQGETKTLYTAVVFNPVPGPPMGKRTQLSFRYFLKGTDVLRVQLYSLTNGYHRCLTLQGLNQGTWQDGNVDLTRMRKPDGSGGALSENERIDDIQFYCDPRAELWIDDIVLFDAGLEDEKRPFPKRFLFTGTFDSGKQGKEWPGSFEIAPKQGYFWNAAKSVPHPKMKDTAWLHIGLRGDRTIGAATAVSFRYKLDGADAVKVALESPQFVEPIALEVKGLKRGEWAQTTLDFSAAQLKLRPGDRVRAVDFYVPAAAQLLIDDLLLFEPAPK